MSLDVRQPEVICATCRLGGCSSLEETSAVISLEKRHRTIASSSHPLDILTCTSYSTFVKVMYRCLVLRDIIIKQ